MLRRGYRRKTLANVYMALDQDLELIPVLNKIDLPNAEPERIIEEMCDALGFSASEVLQVSAKEGLGTKGVLDAIVERVPPPRRNGTGQLRALIFDSKYDSYKGVIAYVRVFDGQVSSGEELKLMSNGVEFEGQELTVFTPWPKAVLGLSSGEVGGIATGLKEVRRCRVRGHTDQRGNACHGGASRVSAPEADGFCRAVSCRHAGIHLLEGRTGQADTERRLAVLRT